MIYRYLYNYMSKYMYMIYIEMYMIYRNLYDIYRNLYDMYGYFYDIFRYYKYLKIYRYFMDLFLKFAAFIGNHYMLFVVCKKNINILKKYSLKCTILCFHLQTCRNHIKPALPENHYKAVCRALVTETIELRIFLQQVLNKGEFI